ncbi:MAG TPA: hypothetical protein VFE92_13650, partial [Dermatophilaceae bacterium]|nr:hypothetical protein [Dermatophilaceae bacterium]
SPRRWTTMQAASLCGDRRLAPRGERGEREPGCPLQARQGEPDVRRPAEYKNSISQPTEVVHG